MTLWLGDRSWHGGVDEIPMPEGPGRLWLCGKRFVGPDAEAALAVAGADRMVCLCERHELEERYPGYVLWLAEHGGAEAIWYPIPDLHCPTVSDVRPFLSLLREQLAAGHALLMHCGAGMGRAGTMAAALLMTFGVDRHDAVATIAGHRPLAGPETGAQTDLLARMRD